MWYCPPSETHSVCLPGNAPAAVDVAQNVIVRENEDSDEQSSPNKPGSVKPTTPGPGSEYWLP